MHTTDNLNDGYIGSGKRLWYSIKKYGKENFKCEILEFLPDRSSLKKKEKELINEETIKDEKCLNLVYGGGGWPSNGNAIGGDKFKNANLYWEIPENKEKLRKRMSDQSKKMWEDEKYRNIISNIKPMLGKKHSSESIEKMKGHTRQVGEKNSQFGKSRSDETKNKIRESINKRLNKTDNLNKLERRRLHSEKEKLKYTIDGIFFNKYRRIKIKEIFNIDLTNEFIENINKLKYLLHFHYICENNSTVSIAKKFNTNSETIRNYIKLFKLQTSP